MILTREEFQRANEAELQRLIIKGLTPEQEVIARRYYSDKEREGMDESDFCGPHKSFPIKTAADVSNAAHLIGHADDPASVKACIIRKAKSNGWALPDAWKEAKSEDRAVNAPIQTSNRIYTDLPLVRVDAAKRQVWGQATAEIPDSYGTIFAYLPELWRKLRGKIREQNDSKKAVGNRIDLECDDQNRAIYVGARVSRGAQDTWLKVEDNVLTGFSASVIPDPEFGTDSRHWPKKQYGGKEYPYLPKFTVAELSLVDSPACPNCDIQIVRADGFATDVLDIEEETSNTPSSVSSLPLDRAGARVSSDTRAAMHKGIAHTLRAAVSQMQNCNCDNCMTAQKMIDPDGDGDIDIGSFDDPDQDADDLYNGRDADMRRAIEGIIERILEQKFTSVTQRLQGIAGTLARSYPTGDTGLTRTMESSLAEVRASLLAVKEQVDKIANTPVPGAPIMNTSVLPKPAIEKRLPTDPYQPPRRSGSSVYDAIARMSEQGELDSLERQTDAIAAGLIAQRRGQ